ncbi:MAG: alanine/glycine:cation symporter family protein [Planctomycetota bacterium]
MMVDRNRENRTLFSYYFLNRFSPGLSAEASGIRNRGTNGGPPQKPKGKGFSFRVALFGSVLLSFLCNAVHAQEATRPEVAEIASASAQRIDSVNPHSIPLPAALPAKTKAEDQTQLPQWIEAIDGFFGTYLVKPLETVLFYDFETPRWLGASVPFVVVWLLFAGVFLTIRMGFINFRLFKHSIDLIRGKYDKAGDHGDVSHFQALASALSGTVGLGNIAGVAIAIGLGGPGATFWLIFFGLIGMTTKFAECTLAVMYRTTDEEGHVLGGPMVYLRKGLAEKGLGGLGNILAILFTILCIGGAFGGGNSYQVAQSLNAFQSEEIFSFLKTSPWIYGLVMAFAVGIVIIGGIKSIGNFAGTVVPFMCGAYILMCLTILATNYQYIPFAAKEILVGAFSPAALYGGFFGVLVVGAKRACFSNEAGAGSAAIAHSAAKTQEPVSEGIVALLEPFIDTVVVCTLTGLLIVITGVYRQPEVQQMAVDNQGSMITLAAITQNPSLAWFKYLLYLAIFLFAYSTCVSWSYYGERCFVSLFGQKSSLVFKLLFVTATFLGSVISPTNVLEFSDMMILTMAVPNLIGVFILSNVIYRELQKYIAKLKSGEIRPVR